jgi:hypothetical protein
VAVVVAVVPVVAEAVAEVAGAGKRFPAPGRAEALEQTELDLLAAVD